MPQHIPDESHMYCVEISLGAGKEGDGMTDFTLGAIPHLRAAAALLEAMFDQPSDVALALAFIDGRDR